MARKKFPASEQKPLRLLGNKTLAATYIRPAQQEMLRTKALVDQMGVPTFQRIRELEDGTRITTLVENRKDYIFIDSPFPEIPEEVPVEEEKEEEKYKCHPGFTVYRNLVSGKSNLAQDAEARPLDDGEILSYDDRRRSWYIDEDTESYNHDSAQLSWFGLKENVKKKVYNNDTGLEECSLISWLGEHGGVCATYFKTNYSKNIFFQGRIISMSGSGMTTYMNVIGACLLPSNAEKKDYFYSIHCDFGNSYDNWSPGTGSTVAFWIMRRERNPKILVGGDQAYIGSAQTVGKITGADLVAASGGAKLIASICPAIHIDKDGIAYIGVGVSFPYTSVPTGKCSDYFNYVKNTLDINNEVTSTDKTGDSAPKVYGRLKIRLKDAKVLALDVPFFDNGCAPQGSQRCSSVRESYPTVGSTRYGCRLTETGTDSNGDPCGSTIWTKWGGLANDIVQFVNPEGLAYIDRVKIQDQVKVPIIGNGGGTAEIRFPRPVPIYGFGCQDGYYEYALVPSNMIDTWSKKLRGGPNKTIKNADYDASEPNEASHKKVPSLPLYEKTVTGDGTSSGGSVNLICTNIFTGENALNLRVADLSGYGDSGYWSLTKNGGLQFGYDRPNRSDNLGPFYGYDPWYGLPDAFNADSGSTVSWNKETALGKMYGGITGCNYRSMSRRLMWHHPMVPDLVGYIETTDDIAVSSGSGTSVRYFVADTTQKYVFDGTTYWTLHYDQVSDSGQTGISCITSYGVGIGYGDQGSAQEECYSPQGGNYSIGTARDENWFGVVGQFGQWGVDYGAAMENHCSVSFTWCSGPYWHVHHKYSATGSGWSLASPNYLNPYNYYFVSKRYTSSTSNSYSYYFRAHFTFHNMEVNTMKNKWGAKYAFIGYVPQPLNIPGFFSATTTGSYRGIYLNWYYPTVMLPGKSPLHYFVSNVFDDADAIAAVKGKSRTAGQKTNGQDRVDKDYPLDFGVI